MAKLISVEDESLLLLYFDHRVKLLKEAMNIYLQNTQPDEVLSMVNLLLG